MNPMFFGDSSSPLYGVVHPATGQLRDEGILICYPFGQEYMRAHRAVRQLAMLLSKEGYHVLRFDYFGTGNSSGFLRDARVERWLSDVAMAATELRETTGAATVHAVGLRLGALLAGHAAERAKFGKIVLWDPVISGQQYDEELLETMDFGWEAKDNLIDEDGTLYFNGFGLSQEMRNDLKGLDLQSLGPCAERLLHIVSGESPQQNGLRSAWSTQQSYEYSHTEAPGDWNYVDDFGGIILPQPIIQAIVRWFAPKG